MPLEGLTFPNPTLGIQTKRKPRIEALRAVYAPTTDAIWLIKGNADSLVIAYKEQQSFKARGVHQKNLPALSLPLGLRGFGAPMH